MVRVGACAGTDCSPIWRPASTNSPTPKPPRNSADRERVAIGAIRATQRLAGSIDRPIRVRLAGGAPSVACCAAVGPDWLLLTEGQGRDCLVALDAVTAVEGLTAATGPEISGFALRLDLRRALRGLARDRSPVAVATDRMDRWTAGSGSGAGASGPIGAGELTGTIDRVGADFIEVAVHAAWEPRRAGAVRSVALVPLGGIVLVRALPLPAADSPLGAVAPDPVGHRQPPWSRSTPGQASLGIVDGSSDRFDAVLR